jgi:hypothetical protein
LSILEPNVAEGFTFLEKGSLRPGFGEGIDNWIAPDTGALIVVEVEIRI